MKFPVLLFLAVNLSAAGIDELAAGLRSKNPRERVVAVRALGASRDAAAVDALVVALGDRDVNVRFYAAYGLGEIKSPRATEALLEALSDKEWSVRDQAAWALREVGDPAVVGPLLKRLEREDADIPHIMWIIEHLDAGQSLAALKTLLGHARVDLRLQAVTLLEKADQPEATAILVNGLADRDSGVRKRVITILADRPGPASLAAIKALVAREKDEGVLALATAALDKLSRHKDLAAHWSFDDGATDVARDSGLRGVHGAIKGCRPVKGRHGKALQFGGGAFVELGKPAALPIQGIPLTFMAWVKTGAPNGVVVARGGAFQGYSLYIKDEVPRFGMHREETGPIAIAAGKDAVVGRWVHLAGVIKASCIELYVDGALAARARSAGYVPGNCGQGMEIGFDVGNSPAEITDHFVGIIDEVKCYEAALSAQEIAEEAGLKQP